MRRERETVGGQNSAGTVVPPLTMARSSLAYTVRSLEATVSQTDDTGR